MFGNKNKIIEMQETTIKNQEDIIEKKSLENIRLKSTMSKIENIIVKGNTKKIPFAMVVSEIKELVTDVENHN